MAARNEQRDIVKVNFCPITIHANSFGFVSLINFETNRFSNVLMKQAVMRPGVQNGLKALRRRRVRSWIRDLNKERG